TPADLWLATAASIATAAAQIIRLARLPFTALLAFGVPFIAFNASQDGRTTADLRQRRWTWLLIVSAVVAVTLPFCYFPSFYAQNGNPPARSLIVPGAILIGYLTFAGASLGARLPPLVQVPALATMALVLAQLRIAA